MDVPEPREGRRHAGGFLYSPEIGEKEGGIGFFMHELFCIGKEVFIDILVK